MYAFLLSIQKIGPPYCKIPIAKIFWACQGEFKEGAMTGRGVYALPNGGLYDSSVGLYYPDRPVYIEEG